MFRVDKGIQVSLIEKMRSSIRCATLIGLVFCCSVLANARAESVTLESPKGDVVVTVKPEFAAMARRNKTGDLTVLYVRYPSGEPGLEDLARDARAIRILIRPTILPMKTRAEDFLDRARPKRPAEVGSQPWLERTDPDGVQHYAERIGHSARRQVIVFAGRDGSTVAVQLGDGPFVTNMASRRYMSVVELRYQYPRSWPAQAVDSFIQKVFDDNVSFALK